MAIASTRLGSRAVLGLGAVTLYTVPANRRTIVKSVVIANLFAGANSVVLTVQAGGVDVGYYVIYAAAAGTDGSSKVGEPWLVMNAGDALRAASSAGNLSVIVSGAELML